MTNPFQVKMLKQPDGERLPIVLTRSTGTPFTPINEYLLYNLRSSSASSTMENYARTITLLFWWGETQHINMMDRLLSGEGFTMDQILVGLKDFLRKRLATGGNEVINPNTLTERVLVIKNFVSYHLEAAIMRLDSTDPRIDRIRAKKDALDAAFGRLTKEKFYPEQRYALIEKEIGFLLEITDPRSSANPWKPPCRSRNRLIILILLYIAIRRGELLNAYVSDCEINSPIPGIRIVRNPDNIIDPRRDKPNLKTKSRLIAIDRELASAIDYYVQNDRYKIRNSHKTPFLILNVYNGRPLSLRALNHVLEQIKRRHPERFKSLFPHILRHTALTRYREELKNKGCNDDEIAKHLQNLSGWATDNSGTYTAAAIEAEGNRHSLKHQRNLFRRNEDVPF